MSLKEKRTSWPNDQKNLYCWNRHHCPTIWTKLPFTRDQSDHHITALHLIWQHDFCNCYMAAWFLHIFFKYLIPDMAQDSTMPGSWLGWWYLSWSRASPASNVPSASLSWQRRFQSQGQTTSHLSSCFPLVCSEPRFPQNSHVSYLASGYFWGALCVWLEAFLARFEHVSPVSHYVSTPTTCRFSWAGCRDIGRQFWPLTLRVCYEDYHGPIQGTKQHSKNRPMSSHPRRPCRAKGLSQTSSIVSSVRSALHDQAPLRQ